MSQPRRLLAPALIVLAGPATFAGVTFFLNRNQETPPPAPPLVGGPAESAPPARVRMFKAEFAVDLRSPQQPSRQKEWRPWQEDPGVLVCPVGPE